MKVIVSLLLLVMNADAWAVDATNAAEVFAQTSAAYKKLKSYEIEGEVHVALANNGRQASFETKTTLAADDQGRSYVESKSLQGTELRVSNGSTTWKYNSQQKAWSKEELSQMTGLDDEDSQDAPVPQDLFSQTARSFVGRYAGLSRYQKTATYVKDEKIKFNGEKVLCHVYRVAGDKGVTSDLWISDQEFFVVRQMEKASGSEVVTEFKRITDTKPDASLFDFQPPKGTREAENVLLPSERNVSLVGTRAADFKLKTLDGEPVHLAELHGKVVLLDFWASWCPPCRHELPTIAALNKKLQGTNVVVLGVNDEEGNKAKQYLDSSHMTLVTLRDSDRKVARSYSCNAIPTVVIIDTAGKIVAHYVGERGEQQFMTSLREAGMK